MNKPLILLCVSALFFGQIACAQDTQDASSQTLGTIIQNLSEDEVMPSVEGEEESFIDPDFLMDEGKSFDDYGTVSVRMLDKITAESRIFDLEVGKTVAYGSLRIRPMTCKKAPPIEEPESAAFLQIWEKIYEGSDEWVFSGWMFASSPSLSAVEHPVYDLWVVDCKDLKTGSISE